MGEAVSVPCDTQDGDMFEDLLSSCLYSFINFFIACVGVGVGVRACVCVSRFAVECRGQGGVLFSVRE